MTKSMTGYGVATRKVGPHRVSVEAKSVNHKYCEVNLRLPPRYSMLEGKIVQLAKSFFNRGRIDILLREDNMEGAAPSGKIDVSRLQAYFRQLKSAAKTLGISPEVRMETLLTLPQVIVMEETDNPEKHWKALQSLFMAAFHSLEKMRIHEGKSIQKFLLGQLRSLSGQMTKVESMVTKNIKAHQATLQARIQKLLPSHEIDPQRLAQEVAYYVDRTDISEELDRLKHHIRHFQDLLKSREPLGRKLDFLIQEMNREVNTLSSKSQNALISQRAVDCKHALEKMREQVQNIE